MSTNFDFAIPPILKHEGFRPGHTGLVDDPDDPGGITNYGISLRALKGLPIEFGDFDHDGDVDADDIKNMTYDDAVNIYRQWYWSPYLDELHHTVAYRIADHWVNAGMRSATTIAQRAVRAHGKSIAIDGALGPKTVAALKELGHEIVPAIRSERAGFYRTLVAAKPKFEKYRRGWLRRAYS